MYQSLVSFQGWTFIAQILNLFIQIYLFKRFLFKPVKKIFEQRQSEVDAMYDDASKAKQDAEAAKESYESHLRTAAAEAEAITTRAVATAQRRSDEIVGEAQRQAAFLKEKAQSDIALERKKAINEVKNDISCFAVDIAAKVVEREISVKDHEALIEEFINNVGDAS